MARGRELAPDRIEELNLPAQKINREQAVRLFLGAEWGAASPRGVPKSVGTGFDSLVNGRGPERAAKVMLTGVDGQVAGLGSGEAAIFFFRSPSQARTALREMEGNISSTNDQDGTLSIGRSVRATYWVLGSNSSALNSLFNRCLAKGTGGSG